LELKAGLIDCSGIVAELLDHDLLRPNLRLEKPQQSKLLMAGAA
jgi:hypothetical protein